MKKEKLSSNVNLITLEEGEVYHYTHVSGKWYDEYIYDLNSGTETYVDAPHMKCPSHSDYGRGTITGPAIFKHYRHSYM